MNVLDLICNGWISKSEIDLFIDYKRNINDPNILSTLKISHYTKCVECNKKQKIINKQEKLLEEKKLISNNDKILKNEYILIFTNELLSQLPLELRNIDRILPLIQLFVQNKLKYEINIHHNYLMLNMEYRLYNILNKVKFHLLNLKIYECFQIYNNLALTLNTYKSDLIKQNEFEDIRRRLLLLDDLGTYNYLKDRLNNKLHAANYIKKDRDEDTCCKLI